MASILTKKNSLDVTRDAAQTGAGRFGAAGVLGSQDFALQEQRWYHQQESNLYLALRRHSFYPLNYGGTSWQLARNRNCMR